MEDLYTYYGIDWFGMITTLLAAWLLGNKNKLGFVSFIVSNISWVFVGILASSIAIIIGNVIFLFMNVRGLIKWNVSEQKNQQ